MAIPITFFYGIVIRQSALATHSITKADLLKAFEVEHPLGESHDLISFGPSFGQEACDAFIRRLEALGLIYVDDFFDLAMDHPDWLSFSAKLS